MTRIETGTVTFRRAAIAVSLRDFLKTLEVNFADAAGDDDLELLGALGRSGEQNVVGLDARGLRRAVFAERCDLDACALIAKQADDRRGGVGLDRIVNPGEARQRFGKRPVTAAHDAAVIDEQRRAVARGELAHRDAADQQVRARDIEVACGEVAGECG